MPCTVAVMITSWCLALTSIADAATGTQAVSARWRAAVEEYEARSKAEHVVGASALLMHDGAVIEESELGFADAAARKPVSRDTIYHWASNTKTLTAIAIMQLRDRGLLKLDDPVTRYLPELGAIHNPFGTASDVTIQHLLTHSSGLRAATWPWGHEPWQPFEPTQWSQLVAMFPYTQLEFAPGSKYSYSNPGITLLGRVVEVLSGENIEVYLDKHVLKPLEMYRSYFDITPWHLRAERSHNYLVDAAGKWVEGPVEFDTGVTVANGGLNAPLSDMMKYTNFLLGVRDNGNYQYVLSRATLAQMLQPRLTVADSPQRRVSIGLGFFIVERKDARGEVTATYFGHSGSQNSFRSWLKLDMRRKVAFLAATNTSGPEGRNSAMDLLGEAVEQGLTANPDYDLWIKGGLVYDGSGAAPRKADVLVKGDRIVHVGAVTKAAAARVIEATGKSVAPGFIDTHAHGDPLEDASFESFVRQGVTAVVLGQDGRTPGYASEHGTDEDAPPLGRKTLAQWMQAVEAVGSQTNIAAVVGHGTLRWQAGVGVEAEPTSEQLRKMQSILREGLQAGAYGMSSGLEYVPGRYAHREELVALAETVGAAGGVVMSHMRSEDSDSIADALNELVAQGRHSRVHASHLKIVFAQSAEEGDRVIDLLDAARARGVQITADVYPYLAGYGDLSLLYPPWAKTREEWNRVMSTDRARLETYLRDRIAKRGGAEAILLADPPYANQTLQALARQRKLPPEKVVIDVLGFGGPNAAHFIMRADVQDRLIAWDHAAISTDGGPWVRHPRSWGTYPKVLQEHVRERKLMTLSQAIRKMSSLPAEIVGLPRRGRVEAGYFADIVLFDPNTVRSNATWAEPAQAPSGIDHVIVNGCVQVENARLSAQHCGKVLRKKQPS